MSKIQVVYLLSYIYDFYSLLHFESGQFEMNSCPHTDFYYKEDVMTTSTKIHKYENNPPDKRAHSLMIKMKIATTASNVSCVGHFIKKNLRGKSGQLSSLCITPSIYHVRVRVISCFNLISHIIFTIRQ